ncbi:MAG TPA: heavy metal-binding domain-containing protein [Bryobacteraceae bacterium]|nr:heavy metal-binding domain-containing protein [Bryobacteraceae bacterium]
MSRLQAARGSLICIAFLVIISSCGPREKSAEAPAAAPASTALPKYRGSSTTKNGLHTEVNISAQGDYTVYFMDAAGDDLPAAQLSGVSLNGVKLAINDSGEAWIGKGPLPASGDLTARLDFSMRSAGDSATVALTTVDAPLDYVCPMDPDVRSATPGVCPRCGMTLVMGIPDPVEFPLRLQLAPAEPRPREKVELIFSVENPETGKIVDRFQTVHERLFHLFIVNGDLQYFVHDHPKYDGKGEFRYAAAFPKPGMYRVLGDFYPAGATPQLAPKTIFVGGGPVSLAATKLAADTGPKKGANSEVDLVMGAPPVAGAPAQLFFEFKPASGLERYLGAWAHMLAASDDLIDLLHEHPYSADNGRIEFDLTFPRARTYRLWVQFQRDGAVNTVAFNVPVQEVRP